MLSLKPVAILFMALFVLSACQRGFDLEEDDPIEEGEADRIFIGANEQASWKLLLDDDTLTFTLEKRLNPGSSSELYTLNGNFSYTTEHWLELDISSDLESDITDDVFYGIEISDHALVLEPFTNVDDEWVPMVSTTSCPSSDLGGLAMFLNQPSDANSSSVIWVSEFDYDVSEELLEYSDGVALDENLTVQPSVIQLSDNCSDGYVQRSAGDHYLGDASTLIELDDDIASDGYTRAFSLPSKSLDTAVEFNNDDYIGLVRDMADPSDFYRVSASCNAGVCDIQRSGTSVFNLNLPESGINYDNIDGVISGTLDDAEGLLVSTRVVCMAHDNLEPPSSFNTEEASDTSTPSTSADDEEDYQMYLMCTAQSLSDNSAPLQLLLSTIEED